LSNIAVKSSAVVQARLKPAKDFLLLASPPDRSQTHDQAVLHMFSRGGWNTALQLSLLIREGRLTAGFPVPLVGVILDSCPGPSGFNQNLLGTSSTLHQRNTSPASICSVVRFCHHHRHNFYAAIMGLLSSVEDLRRELNNLNSFGAVPRLYLHSKGDRFVAAEDVASHAAEIGSILRSQEKCGMLPSMLIYRSKMHRAIGLQYVALLMACSTPEVQRSKCHVCETIVPIALGGDKGRPYRRWAIVIHSRGPSDVEYRAEHLLVCLATGYL
jgi:hypothetical protein